MLDKQPVIYLFSINKGNREKQGWRGQVEKAGKRQAPLGGTQAKSCFRCGHEEIHTLVLTVAAVNQAARGSKTAENQGGAETSNVVSVEQGHSPRCMCFSIWVYPTSGRGRGTHIIQRPNQTLS